jgi:glutathione synthase/RimK-type ligase-like ATP-grasp enzyme
VIVLWGLPGDGPLDAVQEALRRRGAAFRLLDQRRAAASVVRARVVRARLSLTLRDDRGETLDFDAVKAFYLRPVETARALAAAGPTADAAQRRARAEAVERAIVEWADAGQALVVNPPVAMAANNSKPYQLQLIRQQGLVVPPTLVTTDPEAVRAFAAEHGRLIYKSVSGVRSIVNVLDAEGLAHLDDVANVPTQFQAWIPGHDFRVHVIGDEVHATEIHSGANDYRYASQQGHGVAMAPADLPADLAKRCRVMARAMGLAVAGIDLRQTPDGRWVCFEVNPSPAFVYYEEATGQPLADAVARLLMRAAGLQSEPALRLSGKATITA